MRVGEGLKTFGVMGKIFYVRIVSLGVLRDLFELEVVRMMTYGVEA